MLYLSQSFMFDAAHTLTRVVPIDEFEASRRVHGHSYTAVVTIAGHLGSDGMLAVPAGKKQASVDLFLLRKATERARLTLDHQMLDEIPDLGPGTLENLCTFIAAKVGESLPVHSVTVSRQAGDSCRLELAAQESKG